MQRHGSEYAQLLAGSYRILRNGSMGLFQITIWTTHLNNRISVSANEIVFSWILKRSVIPIVILIESYQRFLIAEIDFFQLNPATST